MIGCEGLARIRMQKAATSELDVSYPIRSECQADVPKTRFKLRVTSLLLLLCYLLIPFVIWCVLFHV